MNSSHLVEKIFGNLFILVCLALLPPLPNFLFYVAGFIMFGIIQVRLCPQTHIFYSENSAIELHVQRGVIGWGSFIFGIIALFGAFSHMV